MASDVGFVVFDKVLNEFSLCICDRGCSCDDKKTKKKLKDEYNELYQPGKFAIDERYTSMLVTLTLCLFYGSGMPILYLAAASFFFVQFWLDKIMLLKSYKRPPQYDEVIANQSLVYMKLILIVH
jgi:hypothetical protein